MDDSKIKPKLEPCFEVPDWEHSPKKKHKKNPVDKSAFLEVLFNTPRKNRKRWINLPFLIVNPKIREREKEKIS